MCRNPKFLKAFFLDCRLLTISDTSEAVMAVSPPDSSDDEPEELEYLALKTDRRERHCGLMIRGQKAMEAGEYAEAVVKFHQALSIMPTFQAVYGRTCALFSLGTPLEIPEKYQGGKSDSCLYHFCKARATLLCVCKEEYLSPDQFKSFVNDAWSDLVAVQENSYHGLSSVWSIIRDLKKVGEDVDATSMDEKIEETEEIVKRLRIFQPELVSHVSSGYLSGPSSDSSPASTKESAA